LRSHRGKEFHTPFGNILIGFLKKSMQALDLQKLKSALPVDTVKGEQSIVLPRKLDLQIVTKTKVCLVCVLMFLNVATAATASSAAPKHTTTVVLASEFAKALFSLLFVANEEPQGVPLQTKVAESMARKNLGGLFVVATLYVVVNNCFMLALRYINIDTYQVLFSLRIPVTAALMHLFLGRKFTARQQIAGVLLFCGGILSQADLQKLSWAKTPPLGLFYVAVMVVSSSVAGVLNESILKNDECGSLHAKNFQLYAYGFFLNLACTIYEHGGVVSPAGAVFFDGVTISTCFLICLLAAQGLVTSAVIKYTDNMIKAAASVGSIGASAALAYFVFKSTVSFESLCSAILTSASLALYLL